MARSVHDPIARYRLVYLNGPGGCAKSTRAIELFRGANLIVLTPTHRLAREIKQRKVETCTYHSFFRYRGENSKNFEDWSPERMGTKKIPDIII